MTVYRCKPDEYPAVLKVVVKNVATRVKEQVKARSYLVMNELRNADIEVMAGGRSGRMYGGHQASAPGEPPAVRSGNLRGSLSASGRTVIADGGSSMTVHSTIETSVEYAGYMEYGTPRGMIAPRPYCERIQLKALPPCIAFYSGGYG